MSITEKIKILSGVLGSSYREGQSQLLYHCPKCDHHKKKLSVNIEKNVFKCWICDWSGRNIYRIIKRYGDYGSKRDWLRLNQQVEVNDFAEKLFGEKAVVTKRKLNLPRGFTSLVNKDLPSSSIRAINYLKSRFVDETDVRRWKLGYCSEGEYSGRIVAPSFDMDGDINYFVGRSYDDNWIKYLNPSYAKDFIFNELYLDFAKEITIVEGVFDAMKAGDNAVPLLGSTLTEHSNLFTKIVENDTTVYLALDADARKKIDKIIRLFFKYDIETYLLDTGHFKDVGEMTKEQFSSKKQDSILLDPNNYLLSKIMGL